LGETHPTVAWAFNGLSRALVEQRRYDEAAAALERALDIARPALGGDHQLVAIYAINLGRVQLARRPFGAAEALIREGLEIWCGAPGLVPSRRRAFLEDDWSIGATKSLLGAALTGLGRYPEAESMLVEARTDLAALSSPPARDVKLTESRL